jgi:hypothetical protein
VSHPYLERPATYARPLVARLTSAAAGWALLYAAYRGYYTLGGTFALPGVLAPGSSTMFQTINTVATTLLLAGAAAPFLMDRLAVIG